MHTESNYHTEGLNKLRLDKIKIRQINNLIKLNFHSSLKLTEDQYRKNMPFFNHQPVEYIEQFDLPLIIETRIPLKEQLEKAGFTSNIDISKIRNATPVPRHPYSIWIRNLELSELQKHRRRHNEEKLSPIIEVISFALQYPDLVTNKHIYALGSRCPSGFPPFIEVHQKNKELKSTHFYPSGINNNIENILTRGNKINMLNLLT